MQEIQVLVSRCVSVIIIIFIAICIIHTGTSSQNSRSRSGTEEPGDEVESENFSGDETDGESSILSHSSHGGNAYSIEEPKKPKRTRTAYSNNQLDQLELVFSQTQYPDVFLREELAKSLGIKEDRIQVSCHNY